MDRVIAIDGPAGSGKSTLARRLARRLGLPYVNTGLMYRALAAAALREHVDVDDEARMLDLASTLRFRLDDADPQELAIDGYATEDLSTMEVESTVSGAARHASVRRLMCRLQRSLGADGSVMEGRDIGSVVFPDAVIKFYLQADAAERATRRAKERSATATDVEIALEARDARDDRTARLQAVDDAVILDTSELDADRTLAAALEVVHARWPEAFG